MKGFTGTTSMDFFSRVIFSHLNSFGASDGMVSFLNMFLRSSSVLILKLPAVTGVPFFKGLGSDPNTAISPSLQSLLDEQYLYES